MHMTVRKHRSAVLTFLGQYRSQLGISYYTCEGEEDRILGVQISEAPIKYLLKYAQKCGNDITDVVCVLTREITDAELSALKGRVNNTYDRYFRSSIIYPYCGDGLKRGGEIVEEGLHYPIFPRVHFIDWDPANGSAEQLLKNIGDALDIGYTDGLDLYADQTATGRESVYLMPLILQYLEMAGGRLRKAVYADINQKTIRTIRTGTELVPLREAAAEFLLSGHCTKLKTIVKDLPENNDKTALEKLITFADTLAMNDTAHLAAVIRELAEAFRDVSDDSTLLSQTVTLLKEKLEPERFLDEDKINWHEVVKWCIDHQLTQQAVVLFVEKMPSYWFDRKLIPDDVIFFDEDGNIDAYEGTLLSAPHNSDRETEVFYGPLYDRIAQGLMIHKYVRRLREIGENIQEPAEKLQVMKHRIANTISSSGDEKLVDILTKIQNTYRGFEEFGSYEDSYGTAYGKTASAVIDQCISGRNLAVIHRLCYDNYDAYLDIPRNVSGDNRRTYSKKEYALEVLSVKETDNTSKAQHLNREQITEIMNIENREKLLEVMKYYLALKMVRNRLNYACEKELSEDEEYTIASLKGSFGLQVGFDHDSVERLLREGLAAGYCEKYVPAEETEE